MAIADMGGLVKVWALLLLGDSSGAVWMWKIPSGETKTIQGSNARNTCGTLTADG